MPQRQSDFTRYSRQFPIPDSEILACSRQLSSEAPIISLMKAAFIPLLVALLVSPISAAEPCSVIHGRAHYYCGDGNLRIWHVGTHHMYTPDESSDSRVMDWLEAGVKDSDKTKYACPVGTVDLFADFLICPTEPFKKGSVQKANVKSATHRRYVHSPD